MDVIEELCRQLQFLHPKYAEAKTYNTDLAKKIALTKPINGISKKIRACKTEFDIAARTDSATREEIITPVNLAAHSADVIINAHLVVEYDPKPGSSSRTAEMNHSRYPGFGEQYLLNHIIPPEYMVEFSLPSMDEKSVFWHFIDCWFHLVAVKST
ncbi:uncharacterized protein EAE97_006939 [Botrytis byssoidea]|uniref:Uncharacterized protein n=1 Tax=Botrytis byssoidea TaxID=139641 RepID=A0A9P5IH89_9HELO|nr:uncharacterized protein EAE97_006939 [Botrytis byssoidea]KAF7940753.1 hypothetical protein EAE97_006939 [Botrytis byssoidea]